jgi:hypothetical protein
MPLRRSDGLASSGAAPQQGGRPRSRRRPGSVGPARAVSGLLDTNSFVQAARRECGLDFCPAFWDWLDQANAAGRVHSIQKGLAEWVPGDDVAEWAAARAEGVFLPLQASDASAIGQVAAWAHAGDFTAAAASEFLNIADSQLVAVARARRLTDVTHEVPSNSKRRIKVPTACIALGVSYASPHEMLRKEKARFVLGSAP